MKLTNITQNGRGSMEIKNINALFEKSAQKLNSFIFYFCKLFSKNSIRWYLYFLEKSLQKLYVFKISYKVFCELFY